MEPSNQVNPKKLNIKDIRKKLGLSQAKFAKKLGVRRQTVSEWENDHSYPSFLADAIVFHSLLKEIGCSFDDLLLPESENQN